MSKKLKQKIVISSNYDLDTLTVKEVIDKLSSVLIDYPNAFFDYDYDWESVSIQLCYWKEETNEEYKLRLKKEKEQKEKLIEKKRKNIKKLEEEVAELLNT